MRYWIIPATIFLIVFFLFVRIILEEKNKKKIFEKQLYDMWGKEPLAYQNKKYRKRCSSGFQKIQKNSFFLDAITWDELDMDEVFARLDYTCSQAGMEYLYATLHCPAENIEDAAKWEQVVQYFAKYPVQRVRVQTLLAEIGKTINSSFFDCVSEIKKADYSSPIKEYLANAAYLLTIFLIMYDMAFGLFTLAILVVYQILTYFRERAKILPWLKCVAGLVRMADCIRSLEHVLDIEVQQEIEKALQINLHNCTAGLSGLKKHSFWVLQCGRENSSPLSIFGDYIRMLFHTDIIQFAHLRTQMLELETEIQDGAVYTGFVDSCISIAMYRASLDCYCIPELYEENTDFSMTDGYHPLLKQPIQNSIYVNRNKGVLLTGSNASGKSTFLKTVAVNLILAQTIHTTLAKSFTAPLTRIYTAMGARDSIQKGESSYMAEILSLKRILDAGENKDNISCARPIFAFMDEILRGTNTVERIAAATEILKYFRDVGMQCFAATHDRELTQLLASEYDNYHFTEEIKDGDIRFSYRLLNGSADTSNAIRLLEATGYNHLIIDGATKRATEFLKERVWK